MVLPAVTSIALLVAKASPKAFAAFDLLCDALVVAGGVDQDTRAGRAISALKVACDVRNATKRRRRKR